MPESTRLRGTYFNVDPGEYEILVTRECTGAPDDRPEDELELVDGGGQV